MHWLYPSVFILYIRSHFTYLSDTCCEHFHLTDDDRGRSEHVHRHKTRGSQCLLRKDSGRSKVVSSAQSSAQSISLTLLLFMPWVSSSCLPLCLPPLLPSSTFCLYSSLSSCLCFSLRTFPLSQYIFVFSVFAWFFLVYKLSVSISPFVIVSHFVYFTRWRNG